MPGFEVKMKAKKSSGQNWTASLSREKDSEIIAVLERDFGDVPKRVVLLNALGCLFAQMDIEDGVQAVQRALSD